MMDVSYNGKVFGTWDEGCSNRKGRDEWIEMSLKIWHYRR
jgi:hypothetical protein